ncbi:NACHT domain-containing protein [Actinokineospora fastidiosa]|uniref:NACHT domain-containing protein n=1 Tax=Actinokineospora fastidiosa TaxID=1816 RepID=UPI00167187FB|nr:NACHT domain-containing protein [Actinokineospora fastidiosa]
MSRRGALVQLALWGLLVLGLILIWSRHDANAVATALTILTGAAAVTQFLMAGRWKPKPGASTPEQVDAAVDALARELVKQWVPEGRRRMLDEPNRLDVRCAPLHGGSGDEVDCDELVAAYADAPRRLVVVGPPGSGKTGLCVLLTLEMLRRPDADRVPLLVPVSAWNPDENFEAWLLTWLLETYPSLGSRSRYGPTAAREILARDRVLLVLDGLDELPDDQRTAALRAINSDLGAGRPLVLTSRTAEFASANAGGQIRDSQVVRLLPLRDRDIVGHLRTTVPQAGIDRWEPVLAELTDRPDGPLGQVLRTPLMLSLAHSVYSDPKRDVRELLGLPDAEAVAAKLLDEFTTRAFTTRRPSPLDSSEHRPGRWPPRRAERWLGFLADQYREVAWWQLWRKVPAWVFVARGVLIGGTLSALLGWLLLGLFGRPVLGLLLGAAVGLVSGVCLGLVPADPPRRFVPRVPRRDEVSRDLVFAVVGAVAGGVAVGALYGGLYGVVIGLVFGAAFGLVRRFTEPTEPTEAVTPDSVLRDDRRAVLIAAALGSGLGMLVGAFFAGVIGLPAHDLVVPITDPVQLGLLGGAVGLLCGAGGLGLATYATSASARFNTARIWLAVTGKTPWRLMAFLRDAHRVGVLRLVGPVYQFRHELLRDRLARRR